MEGPRASKRHDVSTPNRAARTLGTLGLSQKIRRFDFQSLSESLNSRYRRIALATFDSADERPVHSSKIRKLLLRQSSPDAKTTDRCAEAKALVLLVHTNDSRQTILDGLQPMSIMLLISSAGGCDGA